MVLIFLYSLDLLNKYLGMFGKVLINSRKGYIKENIYFTMNLKERGVTVGDLLIIFIIILSTIILVKTFNKDKKTLNHSNQEKISYDKFTLFEIDLKTF